MIRVPFWNDSFKMFHQNIFFLCQGIKGGTVDYGKAHAEKYGMKRYGKTYPKPMLPQWGTLDENGDLVKVNLIGHSFGGLQTGHLARLPGRTWQGPYVICRLARKEGRL